MSVLPYTAVKLPDGEQICLRAYSPADDAVIYDAWTRQIFASDPLKRLTRDERLAHRRSVLEPSVARGTTLVACWDQNPLVVFGWACGEVINGKPALHFCYVKDGYRQRKIATMLLRHLFPSEFKKTTIYATHNTRQLDRLRKKWNLIYYPYLSHA